MTEQSQALLPDTQLSDGIEYSQDVLDSGWAVLCCTKRSYRTLVMTNSQYSVGRSPHCDIVFEIKGTEDQEILPNSTKVTIYEVQNKIFTFSKVHFKVIRDSAVVYLEDTSSNGTYVNGRLVGKGKKVILQNNDEISLSHPIYKYFVYIDKQPCIADEEWSSYPDLKDNYFISKTLGSGSYGEVKLVLHKRTFVKYAMKIVKMESVPNNGETNEVEILKALDNPFIIKHHHVINATDKIFIFLEYMEGGDLFRRIRLCRKLNEICAKWIFYQLVRGVEYLHDEGIAHRDLKPENILLSSDDDFPVVKISDFGLSKFFNSVSVLKTLCGTPLYVAPEILETKGRGIYSNLVDVWSLGVILYVCLSGSHPFNLNRQDMNLDEQIMRGEYSFKSYVWRSVSSEAKGLISRMMSVNPKMRITIKMVKTHPWLKNKQLEDKLEQLGEKLKQLDKLKLLDFHEEGNENEPPPKRTRC